MNGPDHYRDAERLAENAAEWLDGDTPGMTGFSVQECRTRGTLNLAAAQVHATLALAAATALQAALPLVGDDQQVTEWCGAIGATLDTNQGARIASALALIDEMYERGLILDDVNKLRAVLGAKDGDR